MPLLRTIVSDHLEDVEHNRLPRIAKVTGQPIEAIKDSLEHLRRLDPAPGADYQEAVASVIVPEIQTGKSTSFRRSSSDSTAKTAALA